MVGPRARRFAIVVAILSFAYQVEHGAKAGRPPTAAALPFPSEVATSMLTCFAVAFTVETAVTGAIFDGDAGGVHSGAAYVFTRSIALLGRTVRRDTSDAACPRDDAADVAQERRDQRRLRCGDASLVARSADVRNEIVIPAANNACAIGTP